jgi:exosome complex component RRP42
MSRLSRPEIDFIVAGAEQNLRIDGRGKLDFRPIVVETNLAPQTSGSARVRLAETDVLVGIKLDISDVAPEAPDCGRLEVRVDCSPNALAMSDISPVELGRALQRVLRHASALDWKKLCIVEGKQCWTVHVDVLVLQSAGNVLDAVAIAAKAALASTKVPAVQVSRRDTGEVEISVAPDKFTLLDAENVPVCVTLSLVGSAIVVDACAEEEICAVANVVVAVGRNGDLTAVQKGGRGAIAPHVLEVMLEEGRRLGSRLRERLDSLLLQESRIPAIQKGGFLLGSLI